jgi:uncharacterized protein (DUF362 family)
VIRPGDKVVLSPNAVLDRNINANESVFASITHGAVIRCVADYVLKALEGRGQIVIANAPVMVSNFDNWMRLCGMQELVRLYREKAGYELQVIDLRQMVVGWDARANYIPHSSRQRRDRDPRGYRAVDLGMESAFSSFKEAEILRLVGADHDRTETIVQHTGGHHRYHVAQTVLDADVFVAIPKLKVHQKVGVTLSMKGMVGTQGNKNFIPHFRRGHPAEGGDEYPRLGRLQMALNRAKWIGNRLPLSERRCADLVYRSLLIATRGAQRVLDWAGRVRYREYFGNVEGGAWHGNDTAWRMALDLTRIVLCADSVGRIHPAPVRRFVGVVDGIIGGEGEGPLAPRARPCGTIVAGTNPLYLDGVATRIMGFDPYKIPMLSNGLGAKWLNSSGLRFEELRTTADLPGCETLMQNRCDRFLGFVAHPGWQGHIEIGTRCYCPMESRWVVKGKGA